MKVWLADNKIEDFNNNNNLRKEAFEKYVKSEYDKVLEKAINSDETSLSDGAINVDGENSTPTIEGGKKKKIKATKEDLTGKVEPKVKKKNINTRGGAKPENRATDPELEIDLAKLIIIPNNISKGERVKIKRDNPNNTISQDEYDRIFKKQNDLQLAKGN